MEKRKKKVVVACDSYKGSLAADEVCEAAAEGLLQAGWKAESIVKLPIADGGEGTAEMIVRAVGGEMIAVKTVDALGRPLSAAYGMTAEGVAVVELAAASGLPLIEPALRNPLATSTFGTGVMIADALRRGVRRILICAGGSATNDAAMGLLGTLGVEFRDSNGSLLKGSGEELERVESIKIPEQLKGLDIEVACDVTNPFYGPEGAAAVFAPQKGADAATVGRLDRGMQHLAAIERQVGGIDPQMIAGSGAAGGVAGSLAALLRARLVSGAAMVMEAVGLTEKLCGAGLLITGEGRMDHQTLSGKAPMAAMKLATAAGIPTIGIAGQIHDRATLLSAGFADLLETSPRSLSLTEAMHPSTARRNITRALSRLSFPTD